MELREAFVREHLAGNDSMSDLCRRYEVSRKTVYKWVQRFLEGGLPALLDRSTAPLSCPQAADETTVEAIVALKKTHPSWGAKKIRARLMRDHSSVAWPSESTFSRVLNRAGLVEIRKPRRRSPVREHRLATPRAPNDIWCADFKGKFRVERKYCHPLTITDAHSRFVLCCHDTGGELLRPTQEAFRRTFEEYGMPLRLRTDNGTPFASTGIAGLSRLSIWWIKLGILPERIRPGKPQENGRHERMHRTLKAETTRPVKENLDQQQQAFDGWRNEFNTVRPHEALNLETPASVYQHSQRRFPVQLPDPEYPDHFEVRRAQKTGRVRLAGGCFHTASMLGHECIGLEPIADRFWQVWFGPIYLGLLTEQAASKPTFNPDIPNHSKSKPEDPTHRPLSPK